MSDIASDQLHTRVTSEVWPMDCIENGCDHGSGEHLENCPSEMVEVCDECSAQSWEHYEGGVVLWLKHDEHLAELAQLEEEIRDGTCCEELA